ncbi:MAG: HD domain-containing protein [Candidatus Hodarchaeota archaeon]
MYEQDITSIVKDFVYNNSEKDDIHGYPHVIRVYNLCLKIGKELGANLLVLKLAALLHDIGRSSEKKSYNKKNHAEISAEIASDFLLSNNLKISNNDFKSIIHCIKSHSFSNKFKPETIEAKILSDTDKLDALGAIGLYRTIGFTVQKLGGIEQVIEHLENKIMKLKDFIYLDISRKIAEERQKPIIDFYKRIIKEK